jgi:hypothetical protein
VWKPHPSSDPRTGSAVATCRGGIFFPEFLWRLAEVLPVTLHRPVQVREHESHILLVADRRPMMDEDAVSAFVDKLLVAARAHHMRMPEIVDILRHGQLFFRMNGTDEDELPVLVLHFRRMIFVIAEIAIQAGQKRSFTSQVEGANLLPLLNDRVRQTVGFQLVEQAFTPLICAVNQRCKLRTHSLTS